MSLRNPSCVNRQNAIVPSSLFHQFFASAEWMCSTVANASQTFISGKLNELIGFLIRDRNAASGGTDQGLVKIEPALRPLRPGLLHGSLNSGKNQLACGAPFPCGCFVQTAMQVPGKVD